MKEFHQQKPDRRKQIHSKLERLFTAHLHSIEQPDEESKLSLQSIQNELYQDAQEFLKSPSPESMALYGQIMDQLAVFVPLGDMLKGKQHDIQQEALNVLIPWFESNPDPRTARWLFMLYHHGAAIPKDTTILAYEEMRKTKRELPDYADAYLLSMKKAKPYLEYTVGAIIGKQDIDLEKELDTVLELEVNDETISTTLDIANWLRRIAYYKHLTNEPYEEELNDAIRLHKHLIPHDPDLEQYLQKMDEEHRRIDSRSNQ